MIAIVDYGAGNLASVRRALEAVGAEARLVDRPEAARAATAIVVPGVGHFEATSVLGPAWREMLLAHVEAGRPLLGICLGMQWLFEGSDEAPDVPGLGLFEGRCKRLCVNRDADVGGPRLKVPHVGWNRITPAGGRTGLLDGVADGAYMYFTHTFAAPVTSDTSAITDHGDCFAAVVSRGLVCGVQFHPEKSGVVGLRLLRNFVRW